MKNSYCLLQIVVLLLIAVNWRFFVSCLAFLVSAAEQERRNKRIFTKHEIVIWQIFLSLMATSRL